VVRRDAAAGVLEKAKARSAKEIAFIKRLQGRVLAWLCGDAASSARY
jgi:hypothetical protein